MQGERRSLPTQLSRRVCRHPSFTSTDGGDTWELNLPLWNHPSRGGDLFAGPATSRNQWGGTPAAIGYGEFVAGIHSVVVDPRNGKRIRVAVSCAGVAAT